MKKFLTALLLTLFFVSASSAADLSVTTGAGYMKMMSELCAAYKSESGN